ncbi:MAG: hypothetical protein JEY99_18840 [Spirochaetales bacterium]|nr:hypothetical protein [Spirochaetales bacterium]
MRRKLLFMALIISVSFVGLSALDFNVSPNDDGTVDILVGIDWEYSPVLYSAVKANYSNIIEVNEKSFDVKTADNPDYYYTTSGTDLSIGADVLGYRINLNNFRLDVAFNILYQVFDIREVGYSEFPDYHRFLINDRVINLILPRIKGTLVKQSGLWKLELGGEYSPWLSVGLDQQLKIISDNPSSGNLSGDYASNSTQSANNAFSLNGLFRYKTPLLIPELYLEYDHLQIEYEMVTGTESSLDQTLSSQIMVVLDFISLKGIHPSVAFHYDWNWRTKLSEGASGEAELTENTYFTFGFEF